MRLVVDANVVMAMLIALGSKARGILFAGKVELSAPEFLLGEIWEHEQEIVEKSGLSLEEWRDALHIIASAIRFVPFAEFATFIPKAESVCPDPDDVEYFALAFSLGCPFWSNDKALKEKQSLLRIVSTSEVLTLMER